MNLDSASHFWRTSAVLLGQAVTSSGGGFEQYDSTQDVSPAVNLALRAVSRAVPIVGYDTVVVSILQFHYTLDARFIENGLPGYPLTAYWYNSDSTKIQQLKYATKEEIQALSGGVTIGSQTGIPTHFRIEGNRLWFAPVSVAGKIYVSGPVEATLMPTSVSTTNTYQTDEDLVCLYAASLLANSRGDDSKRDFLYRLYERGVYERTGRVPGGVQ